jgi:hypothetical protein
LERSRLKAGTSKITARSVILDVADARPGANCWNLFLRDELKGAPSVGTARIHPQDRAMTLLLLIIIIVLLFGGGGGYYGYRRGYYGRRSHSVIWLILVILLLVVLFGHSGVRV